MIRTFTHLTRLLAAAGLLAAGLLVPASASAGNPCFHDFEMPATSIGTDTQIKLMPCAFAPTVTQVPVGAEVTFFNGPDFSHLITGANQTWGSPDVELAPNATIAYTFEQAGLYPYACVLHPGMSGVIVVGDVADALAAAPVTKPPTSTGAAGGAAPVAPLDPEQAAAVLEAQAAAAQSVAPTGSPEPLVSPLVVGVLVAGAALIAGAGAIWIVKRRRSTKAGLEMVKGSDVVHVG
jgi:plastocyanin